MIFLQVINTHDWLTITIIQKAWSNSAISGKIKRRFFFYRELKYPVSKQSHQTVCTITRLLYNPFNPIDWWRKKFFSSILPSTVRKVIFPPRLIDQIINTHLPGIINAGVMNIPKLLDSCQLAQKHLISNQCSLLQ